MKLFHGGYVYIMANEAHTKLYTGSTSDLESRIAKHKANAYPNSYSARNKCWKLVYYATFPWIEAAILEEKRIKGGSRKKKEVLICQMNPAWRDLSIDFGY